MDEIERLWLSSNDTEQAAAIAELRGFARQGGGNALKTLEGLTQVTRPFSHLDSAGPLPTNSPYPVIPGRAREPTVVMVIVNATSVSLELEASRLTGDLQAFPIVVNYTGEDGATKVTANVPSVVGQAASTALTTTTYAWLDAAPDEYLGAGSASIGMFRCASSWAPFWGTSLVLQLQGRDGLWNKLHIGAQRNIGSPSSSVAVGSDVFADCDAFFDQRLDDGGRHTDGDALGHCHGGLWEDPSNDLTIATFYLS